LFLRFILSAFITPIGLPLQVYPELAEGLLSGFKALIYQ